MFPCASDSFRMCSSIRNVASEVKVLRGGQSCETWLSFPNILSNSLKEYQTLSPLAIFLRSVTNVTSMPCGRDHVKSIVLKQMPSIPPLVNNQML